MTATHGHMGCSSRGGPGSTTTVGLSGMTTPGAVPTGSMNVRPGRHQRLLAIRGQHRFQIDAGKARHQPLHDVGDLGFEPGVQNQFPAAEAGHGRDRHVVGGRAEAAAGDDEIDSLVGKEPKLRLDVVGAVAAQGDVRQLHTQLEQSVGEPGTVAILDSSGQDLGPRHHDARPCAHGTRHYAHRTSEMQAGDVVLPDLKEIHVRRDRCGSS